MNRKGVREEFVKGSGKATVIGSIFLSTLMILSVLAVSAGNNNSIESTSFNQSESMGNSPLGNPIPLNWNEANWYRETGLGDRGRFTIIWTTKGEYTGTVKYSTTSDFDPTSTGFTKTDARGDENYVDDTHYVDVDRVPHDGSMVYYYVESDGTYYGLTAGGEFAPYPTGGEIAIATPTHKNADGPVSWYPVCGHLLHEGQIPPEGADLEITIGWFYDGSGTHGGESPKYPIADITDYNRAWVGGPSAEPDNRHGGYNFDTVWILKTEAGDAEWMPVAGDTITVKGYGVGNENGVSYGWCDNYTLVYGYDTGTDLVPDIILCSPPPTLIANFSVEPDDSPCGKPAVWDTIYFNSTSYGGSASREDLYYEWDFGDGETAAGYGYDGYDNVTHAYYASGIYSVTLEITDDGSPPLNDTITKDTKIWPNRVSTTPLDVREASVKGVKARICWHTCINTTGYVKWGSSPDILDNNTTDMRGDETYADDTHICRITGLTEYTKYYYKVISGSKTYDDFGQPFNFTTGKDFVIPPSSIIRGYVYKSDGITPAEGVLVYMYMEKPNGDKSLLECVYTNSDGRYTKEKRDFRSSDGEHMFEYTTGTDWLDQFAEGATDGTANQTVILTEDNPQWVPDMILSGTPPDKTAPTSTARSTAENPAGTWDVNYTAEDGCATGLDYVELWYNYTQRVTEPPGNNYIYYATNDHSGELEVEGNFTFTRPNGTGYYHFYTRAMDITGNYEPSPKEPDITAFEFDLALRAGLNLISLPLNVVDPTPDEPSTPQGPFFSAQDMINEINANGGSAVAVYKWEPAWSSFYDGDPTSLDFEIKVWEGYLVKCTSASVWNITGTLVESKPVHLYPGLNLIGISKYLEDPTPTEPPECPKYSAQDLINEINTDGGGAVAVYMWGPGWYSFYDGDPPSLDFAIEWGEGYFVKCTFPSNWMP